MTEDIQATVTKLVTDALLQRGIKAQPTPDMSLIDSGLLDSLIIVTFVGQLEKAFGVSISMADMTIDNFDNILLISAFVQNKRLSG